MCGEDQPAASQTSWRATQSLISTDIRALEAAILLVEWDRTAIGEGWLADSYASEMALTTHLLILCLDAGDPLLGGQDIRTTVHFYATGQLCGYKHLMPVLGKANCTFPGPHSERRTEPQVPQRKMRYQGVFPNDIPPKGMWSSWWSLHHEVKTLPFKA